MLALPWRPSGLLSGHLPTDTRPQARAKLGNIQIDVAVPKSKADRDALRHFNISGCQYPIETPGIFPS